MRQRDISRLLKKYPLPWKHDETKLGYSYIKAANGQRMHDFFPEQIQFICEVVNQYLTIAAAKVRIEELEEQLKNNTSNHVQQLSDVTRITADVDSENAALQARIAELEEKLSISENSLENLIIPDYRATDGKR